MELVYVKAYLHIFMSRVYLCCSNARFNFICYYPPRTTLVTSPTLRAREWGIVRRGPVPGVGGGGRANKNILILFDFAKYVLFLARFTR